MRSYSNCYTSNLDPEPNTHRLAQGYRCSSREIHRPENHPSSDVLSFTKEFMAAQQKPAKSIQVSVMERWPEKRFKLQDFMTRRAVGLSLINKPHLRQRHNPKIPNYTLYRNDRQDRRRGGTAIYVRKTLQHYATDLQPLTSIEATASVV